MENKRNVLVLLVIAISVMLSVPVYCEVPAPASINTFYGGMRRLAQVSDENVAYDISKSMNDCFFGMDVSVSGIPLPNDFRFFDYDKKNSVSHNDEVLNSATYVNRLKEYIYKNRVLSVEYRILKSEVTGSQPEFHKGRLSVSQSLVSTCVEKKYILNGYSKIFNDTVLTDYTNGKISEIKNGNGKAVVNINSLRNKASLAYLQKQYYVAYQCYEQIISIAPNDADALYRIGLMTYFQYKDCRVVKKDRNSKARSLLEQAQQHGRYYGIDEKARKALFWIRYNNV